MTQSGIQGGLWGKKTESGNRRRGEAETKKGCSFPVLFHSASLGGTERRRGECVFTPPLTDDPQDFHVQRLFFSISGLLRFARSPGTSPFHPVSSP